MTWPCQKAAASVAGCCSAAPYPWGGGEGRWGREVAAWTPVSAVLGEGWPWEVLWKLSGPSLLAALQQEPFTGLFSGGLVPEALTGNTKCIAFFLFFFLSHRPQRDPFMDRPRLSPFWKFPLRSWPPLALARQQVMTPRKVGGVQSRSVSGVSLEPKTNRAFSLKGHRRRPHHVPWSLVGCQGSGSRGLTAKLRLLLALGELTGFCRIMLANRGAECVTILRATFLGLFPKYTRFAFGLKT